MPKIPYVPPADVQTELSSLAQALNTILPAQRVPDLTATRSNSVALHLNPILLEYKANAKTIRR